MPLTSGQTIINGKYHILKLIGEGGMARVWLAEEITFGGRQVALKEPRSDLLPDDLQELRRRYDREVKVCAALGQANVPSIVPAITAEPYGDSVLLSMAYMPGGDLAGLLREHPNGLPIERAVAIALDVLRALHGAHEHPLEIVHRDVKPSNILFDAQGGAHLGDFGFAQLAGMSQRSQLKGGQHPGTPLYMAPEQATSQDYLMPAADLYALGCVLFEMLTGTRYKRVRPGTPASSLRAEVPAWLDEVLARALAEDPWDRWESAAEMAEALEGEARRRAEEEARRRAEEEAKKVPTGQQISIEAARHYERAAEACRDVNPGRAGDFYGQAARLYALMGQSGESKRCDALASRLGQLPELRLEALNVPRFRQWEAGNLILRIANVGEQAARSVSLALGGSLADLVTARVVEPLPTGERWDIILQVTPTAPKSELVVEAEYVDRPGRKPPFRSQLRVPLEAEPRPEPAIRIGGDMELVRIVQAEGTVGKPAVEVREDAGALNTAEPI